MESSFEVNKLIFLPFFFCSFSSFAMVLPTPFPAYSMESGYHENSPLLVNDPEQLEIVVEKEAEKFQVLPLKLLCAKKIMQSHAMEQEKFEVLPGEVQEVLTIYQPLTIENMFEKFRQAQEVEDKARKIECLDFIKENAMQTLIPSNKVAAKKTFMQHYWEFEIKRMVRDDMEKHIPQEILEDPDFDDTLEADLIKERLAKFKYCGRVTTLAFVIIGTSIITLPLIIPALLRT